MDTPQKPTVMEQTSKIVALLALALDIGGRLVGSAPAEGTTADKENTVLNTIDAALEDALCKADTVVGDLGRLAERLG